MSDGVGGLVDGVGDEEMQNALVGGLNAEGQVRLCMFLRWAVKMTPFVT
jgi:hypothetical protein